MPAKDISFSIAEVLVLVNKELFPIHPVHMQTDRRLYKKGRLFLLMTLAYPALCNLLYREHIHLPVLLVLSFLFFAIEEPAFPFKSLLEKKQLICPGLMRLIFIISKFYCFTFYQGYFHAAYLKIKWYKQMQKYKKAKIGLVVR
jgi:hypothetical protein